MSIEPESVARAKASVRHVIASSDLREEDVNAILVLVADHDRLLAEREMLRTLFQFVGDVAITARDRLSGRVEPSNV
jgi:hypothetical protein